MAKAPKSSKPAKSRATGPCTQSEDALRPSVEWHQAILQAAMDGVWLADTQGRLRQVNAAYCRMSGYSEQELLTMCIADVEAAESSEDIIQHTRQIIAQGEMRFETRHRRKDGTVYDVEVSAQYRPTEGGRMVTFLRDITERKQAESKLRESEQRLHAVIDNSQAGYFFIDRAGHFQRVNSAWLRMHGYASAAEVLGQHFSLTQVQADQKVALHIVEKLLAGDTIPPGEFSRRCRDGSIGYHTFSVHPVVQAGEVVGMEGFLIDTTERQKAQEALRESEQMLRHLTDNLPNTVVFQAVAKPDGGRRFTFISQAVERLNELTAEQVLADPDLLYRQVLPEHLDLLRENREQALKGLAPFRVQAQFRLPSGRLRWFESSATPRHRADGQLVWDGVQVDITERKQAEEALKKSEEKFAKAFKASPTSIAITSMEDGRYVEVNDLFLEQTGFQRDEVIGHTSTEIGVWVDISDRLRFVEELFRNGFLRDFAIQYCMRSGEIRDFSVSSEIIELEGKPCSLNFIFDITERKRVDEELRKLASVVRNSGELVNLATLDGTMTFLNEAGAKMLGIEKDQGEQLNILQVIPEHLKAKVETEVLPALQADGKWQGELQYRNLKTDQLTDVYATTFTVNDPGTGAPLYLANVSLDISKRKQAEANLRASEEKYRSLIQKIQVAVIVHGPDTRILTCNPMAMDLLGLTQDQIHGKASAKPDFHIFHENGTELRVEEYPVNQVIAKRQAIRNLILRVHRPNIELNKDMWVLVNADPVFVNEVELVQVVVTFVDITARVQAEEELREKDARLANIASQVPGMLYQFMRKPDGTYSVPYSSAGVQAIFGCSPAEVRNDFDPIFRAIYPEDQNKIIQTIDESAKNLSQWMCEYRVQLPGQPVKWIFGNSIPEQMADGSIVWSGYNMDITYRKQAEQEKADLEAQLQQAQKLESVGRLAGGVAHDFNNMLGVILGYAELALTKVSPSESLYADMEEIITAAQRSAKVTRQLLAFARKQTVAPKVLDLNETVAGMHKMLARLIGEDIELNWHPGAALWPIKMDPSQIDQMLANLCVNARDAISGVGRITVATGNTLLDAQYCAAHPGSVPGEYVRLTVSDNGSGMDPETLEHIFEPFFTTKGVGEGTGLGLAMVYGAVQQNNGFITADSELGKGTTFTIYLPRHDGGIDQEWREGAPGVIKGGQETILLVEDESAVLMLTTKMLEKQGYTVLAANTPDQALRLAKERAGEIHLLMTDVIMPGMNGRELWQKLSALRPDMKCVFMSGYPANVIAHHGVLEAGAHFIQKPFVRKDLAVTVREAIEGK